MEVATDAVRFDAIVASDRRAAVLGRSGVVPEGGAVYLVGGDCVSS